MSLDLQALHEVMKEIKRNGELARLDRLVRKLRGEKVDEDPSSSVPFRDPGAAMTRTAREITADAPDADLPLPKVGSTVVLDGDTATVTGIDNWPNEVELTYDDGNVERVSQADAQRITQAPI